MLPTRRFAPIPIYAAAAVFVVVIFTGSWWRWWSFQYGSFDLAFYVQSLWLAIHGQWHVSLLNVPMLGNHAEPIVFLAAPLFAICPHPMLLVALQILAIATAPFTAWRISQHLGLDSFTAKCMSIATLLTPATGFVGLHEFHPEALAIPFLLLLFEARTKHRLGHFWLWLLALLATKENLALLMVGFCGVHAAIEWKRERAWQIRWNIIPGLVAGLWLLLYGNVISPALNAGNVDYLELYSHLGNSGPNIVAGFFTEPGKAMRALWRGLTEGNLVLGLLIPLLGLPLLRPQWLIIGLPILLQHLLSWRSSEWSIQFHYAAPLIPIFWIGAAQSLTQLRLRKAIALGILILCGIGQVWIGPARGLAYDLAASKEKLWHRQVKAALLADIPEQASVTAPLPYLSHLATRADLYSLHHVIKGLKTLSRVSLETPLPTDWVVIDFSDPNTFNAPAGYYHPMVRTTDGRTILSSDALLHKFLVQSKWHQQSRNALWTFSRNPGPSVAIAAPANPTPIKIDDATQLLSGAIAQNAAGNELHFRFSWELSGERHSFPWALLIVSGDKGRFSVVKGPCALGSESGLIEELWSVVIPSSLPSGSYDLTLLFYDNIANTWKHPGEDTGIEVNQISLGKRMLNSRSNH